MTTITCGDLSRLGGPWSALLDHDPDHQTAGTPHCYCWREPRPEDWSGGTTSPPDLPSYLLEQYCNRQLVGNVLDSFEIRLCCSCAEEFRFVAPPNNAEYWRWLLEQCCQALACRDQRRTDSSPVAADMDVEAGHMEMEDER